MAVVAIEFAWVDPWTGEWCAGATLPWKKQRAAAAFYSRQIMAMKTIAKHWTGPRTPKLRIQIIRSHK